MKEYTKLDKFLDFIYRDRVRSIEYYFAKRWLDKNFGEHEYWGEVLSNWYSAYAGNDTRKN